FSRDGRKLALGIDREVCVWDPKDRSVVRLPRGLSPVTCLALSPDGRTLASGSQDARIRLWSLAASSATLELGTCPGTCAIGFSPAEEQLVALGADGVVRRWQTTSSAP